MKISEYLALSEMRMVRGEKALGLAAQGVAQTEEKSM